MLFKNKYINSEIDLELKEKGFCVYNYISLKELFLTVQRDYLEILSKINLVFGIITVIFGVISYIGNNFLFLFGFLLFVYLIIFGILTLKLIGRSYYFLKISNVVYTEKGIIIGNELHLYKEEEKLLKKLEEYSEMFEEFLSKPSKINKIISDKKSSILSSSTKNGSSALKIVGNLGEDGAKLVIPIIISYFAYVIFLYIFYYFGYVFGIVIFFLINIFLKIILKFTKNTEVKVKSKIEGIDESFKNMESIDKILSHKIANFKTGEIFNISKDVEKNFSNFYIEVVSIFNQKKELLKLINNSDFKNFMNFEKLEKYFKTKFNKPVLEMISMLNKFEILLEKQINIIKITKSNNDVSNLTLDKKEISLNHQLYILKNNINKLEGSVI